MQRPRTLQALQDYFQTLHWSLEREQVDDAPVTVAACDAACRDMEDVLRRVPDGDELIQTARHNAVSWRRTLTLRG
jgi:hypothetical protein